ncbi:MAG: hypothetical protein R3F46_03285 [bacterium]
MNNTLRERILTGRITELSELSAAEQALVQADAGLSELVAENRALASMLATEVQAPQRGPMLAAAVREGRESHKEQRMTIIERMFAGRSPLVQAGLAVMLIAVFSAAYMGFMAFSSKPAWSMTTGNVLEYTLRVSAMRTTSSPCWTPTSPRSRKPSWSCMATVPRRRRPCRSASTLTLIVMVRMPRKSRWPRW